MLVRSPRDGQGGEHIRSLVGLLVREALLDLVVDALEGEGRDALAQEGVVELLDGVSIELGVLVVGLDVRLVLLRHLQELLVAVVLLEVLLRLADGVLAMEGRGGTYADEGLGGGGVGGADVVLGLDGLEAVLDGLVEAVHPEGQGALRPRRQVVADIHEVFYSGFLLPEGAYPSRWGREGGSC